MAPDPFHAPLLYRHPGVKSVEARRNLAYRHLPEAELLLDVYTPPGLVAGEVRPAIVFIHGGPVRADLPLRPKDWAMFTDYGALAAASGFIGVTFNHRFFDLAHNFQSESDVLIALEYVRANAEAVHVDADRLCLWAFSGGGPRLSLFLREPHAYIRCLVGYYTRMDTRGETAETGALSPEDLHWLSPMMALRDRSALSTPLLLARAGLDRPALNQTIDDFIEAALDVNGDLTVLNHASGRHGFDILDDVPRTHEIIAATLAFVQHHLR
jgi:acetyl esterase/lipase